MTTWMENQEWIFKIISEIQTKKRILNEKANMKWSLKFEKELQNGKWKNEIQWIWRIQIQILNFKFHIIMYSILKISYV